MRVVLIILVMQLLLMPVRSQNVSLQSDMLVERYNMACLDLRVGLPHDHVNDIFVDSKGFIWVSSFGGGVVRYDGYAFTAPFQGDSRSCLGFAEDRCQRLWIAYAEGTVVVDLKKMCRVVPTMNGHDIGQCLQRPTVKVYCDSKGAMWQVARDSIYRYEFDESGCVASISCCPYQGNTPDIAISDIEHNGNVWVSTALGLQRLHVHGNSLQFSPIHTTLQSLNGYFITDLLRQGNRVWIATNEGLHAYDLYNNTLQTFRHSADQRSLPHNHATSLALTDDGQLLVGTLRGICLFDAPRSGFVCWNTTTADCPLPSDFIRCLLNYDGQLWIGTETAGIVRLMPKPLRLQNYVHQADNVLSLPSTPVNAMYASADGTIWVGNVEGGLSRLPARGQHSTGHGMVRWTTANSALSHNSVSVLQPDAYGRLWIGTWGGGINTIALEGNAQPQRLVLPADLQRQTEYVGALAYDKYNDALWIGANEGIFLYDLKTGRIEDPFPNNRNIRGCIGACIDRNGHLWMGCLMGVCDIDLKAGRADKGKFRYRHLIHKLDKPQSPVIDKITCIYETKDGTLWLGSDGYGLYRRLTEKGGQERFEVMTTDDGLSNNAVKGIVDDANGRLWITTNNGLSVYDPHHHTFVNYGERDGLLCQRFYWNSAIKDADGVIYLGSIKGLTAIRGENTDITSPVHLSFTHLVVDNQEITAANSSIIDSDVSLAEKIRLHESNKSFSLSFSALSSAGQPQQFVCRLKGFEDDWTVLKPGEHTVRYTSLKPGTYLFEVKNATETGLDGNTISIKVEVVPYFWKSWWFILLCLMVLSGIFVWLYRLRLASLRRQEAEKLMQPVRKALEESDDPVQLQSRIQNILDTHEYLMQSFHRTVEADKQQTVKSKGFMERATEIMEQNYGNSEFGIDEFAEALGMSRSLVSKRLNHEAGQSTSQFIRNYRLSVAKRLLLDNWANRNITEIAYKVGFNDPKYFTRCFTRQYGCSPSAFVGEDEKVDEK